MKYKNLFLAIAVSSISLYSCSPTYDVKDTERYSRVYMLTAKNVYKKTLQLDGTTEAIRFGATYGGYDLPSEDILVDFAIKQELADSFNVMNGTNYEILPSSSYSNDNLQVTIPKGKSSSNLLEMIIRSTGLKQGGNYVLPVSISNVSNETKVREDMRTSYFVFFMPHDNTKGNKDRTTKVVDMMPISIGGYTYYLMDRNLGATSGDATDRASKGDLYQWGRDADGHQKLISDPSSTTPQFASTTNYIPSYSEYASGKDADFRGKFITASVSPKDWLSDNGDSNNNKLWQEESDINNPCPEGYRIPTKDEWIAILGFPTDSDTPAKVYTNKKEDLGKVEPNIIIAKYHKTGDPANTMTALENIKLRCINDANHWVLEVTKNGNTYKFPTRGTRWENGAFRYDNLGYYWSSSIAPIKNGNLQAYFLSINYNKEVNAAGINNRANGNAVRCVRVVKNE